jgi:hypothetical protein
VGAPETNVLGFTHVNVHQLAAFWADRTSIDILPRGVVYKLSIAKQAKKSPFAGRNLSVPVNRIGLAMRTFYAENLQPSFQTAKVPKILGSMLRPFC